MMGRRFEKNFYADDVLIICPVLIGKYLCAKLSNGSVVRRLIVEVEAYRGSEDLACHASKGRTKRTEVLYGEGGHVYVYLIYGMHWMLNMVSGPLGSPQAVLIRGVEGCSGPGRVSKLFEVDSSFYGENLATSQRIWVEESGITLPFRQTPRIGIDYSGEIWSQKPWRFVAQKNK